MVPSWARAPPEGDTWTIDEIKSGTLMQNISLVDRGAYVTFGRASDQVDVVTAHESCSRRHARIAWDSDGVAWLKDLGSAHGTRVNKRDLPDEVCSKEDVDSGVKGVMLFSGDVLQFGASTRLFCVLGPERFDREVWKETQVKLKAEEKARKALEDAKAVEQQRNTISEQKNDDAQVTDDGVSWGIDMDDENLTYDNQNSSKMSSFQTDHDSRTELDDFDLSSIPDKYRKRYEKLLAKRHKLFNLQRESERITNKDDSVGGLTVGQMAQLAKNREREETLQREITDQEMSLREEMNDSTLPYSEKKQKVQNKHDLINFVDEEVDDRTTINENVKRRKRIDSEESLVNDWKKCLIELEESERNLFAARRKVESLQLDLSTLNESDVDYFFVKNDLDLALDEQKSKTALKEGFEEEFATTEKLLKVVCKEIKFNRRTGYIGKIDQNHIIKNISNEMNPPQLVKRKVNEMPPPAPIQNFTINDNTSISTSLSGEETFNMPPPAPKRLNFKTLPNASKKIKGPSLPVRGTLGTLLNNMEAKQQNVKEAKSDKSTAISETSDKSDTWKAPKNQTGDGRTKLNDKFADRY